MENIADLLGFALLIFSLLAGAGALLQGASVLSKENLAGVAVVVVVAAIGVALIAIPPQKEDEKGDLAQTTEGRGEERRAQDGGAVEGQEAEWTISKPIKEQAEAAADCPPNCSDDAQTVEEEFFHAEARAFVIRHVEPNALRVGGLEFRVKRNPVGEGCFVYDPRTRFHGVERLLVWWVPTGGTAYALNSPAKMVTPGLPWPREAGVDAPSTSDVVDYVFHGKPMVPSVVSKEAPAGPGTPTFTVSEYRIYRAVIDTPMSVSESETLQRTAKRYGVSVQEAREGVDKVQKVLVQNGWMGTPASEIRHASDWQEIVQASSKAQEIEDKIVPWDKLEKGKLYQLLTGVELAHHRHLRILGPYYARAGGIIRVLEVDRTERNHPWYRVRLIKMATIGSQDDIPGWIDGKDLKKKGVAEQQ